MPVAPSTSTVPSEPRSALYATSGNHPDIAGFMPAATASGSAPADSGTPSGVAMTSAIVPHGDVGQPV